MSEHFNYIFLSSFSVVSEAAFVDPFSSGGRLLGSSSPLWLLSDWCGGQWDTHSVLMQTAGRVVPCTVFFYEADTT